MVAIAPGLGVGEKVIGEIGVRSPIAAEIIIAIGVVALSITTHGAATGAVSGLITAMGASTAVATVIANALIAGVISGVVNVLTGGGSFLEGFLRGVAIAAALSGLSYLAHSGGAAQVPENGNQDPAADYGGRSGGSELAGNDFWNNPGFPSSYTPGGLPPDNYYDFSPLPDIQPAVPEVPGPNLLPVTDPGVPGPKWYYEYKVA